MNRRRLAILGSTGSIGTQACEVARLHADRFEVTALTAYASREKLFEQVRLFRPRLAGLVKPIPMEEIPQDLRFCEWVFGPEALTLAAQSDCDDVLVSVVGMVGLSSVLTALKHHKRVLLANKEALVAGGHLVMEAAAREGENFLLPVDSEHSAIFQCLQGAADNTPVKLLLTASGGPFRGRSREELRNVTRAQALDHPNWKMGAKISIDSATMMNKALEVVEAFHLYGVPLEKITVLVHPQSLVHSLVQFTDGSQLAQLGTPDMRIPIAACLFWPRCVDTGVPPLDLVKAGTLQFFAPDDEAFPALKLARRALRERGGMSVVMNAANEAAVELFLSGKCAFADIADLVSAAMDAHAAGEPGHEPFCPPLSCSGDDSLALEREVTILTERMSRLDLKTRELVKQLARAGVDEC